MSCPRDEMRSQATMKMFKKSSITGILAICLAAGLSQRQQRLDTSKVPPQQRLHRFGQHRRRQPLQLPSSVQVRVIGLLQPTVGVFHDGDAHFYGSLGNDRNLKSPIVGITPTADGKGYWLIAKDGEVFPFGDAVISSSMAHRLNAPVVGIAVGRHDRELRGPQGPPGAAGTNGAVGKPGPQGLRGLIGPTGTTGPKGETPGHRALLDRVGEVAARCNRSGRRYGPTRCHRFGWGKGSSLATRPAWASWPEGSDWPGRGSGSDSPTGATGPTGAMGPTGATGPTGAAGEVTDAYSADNSARCLPRRRRLFPTIKPPLWGQASASQTRTPSCSDSLAGTR